MLWQSQAIPSSLPVVAAGRNFCGTPTSSSVRRLVMQKTLACANARTVVVSAELVTVATALARFRFISQPVSFPSVPSLMSAHGTPHG